MVVFWVRGFHFLKTPNHFNNAMEILFEPKTHEGRQFLPVSIHNPNRSRTACFFLLQCLTDLQEDKNRISAVPAVSMKTSQ